MMTISTQVYDPEPSHTKQNAVCWTGTVWICVARVTKRKRRMIAELCLLSLCRFAAFPNSNCFDGPRLWGDCKAATVAVSKSVKVALNWRLSRSLNSWGFLSAFNKRPSQPIATLGFCFLCQLSRDLRNSSALKSNGEITQLFTSRTTMRSQKWEQNWEHGSLFTSRTMVKLWNSVYHEK